MPALWRRLGAKTPSESSSRYSVELKKGESKLFRSLNPFRVPRSRWFFAFCVVTPALIASTALAASSTVASDKRARELQRLLDRVRERLGLTYPVTLELVARPVPTPAADETVPVTTGRVSPLKMIDCG